MENIVSCLVRRDKEEKRVAPSSCAEGLVLNKRTGVLHLCGLMMGI